MELRSSKEGMPRWLRRFLVAGAAVTALAIVAGCGEDTPPSAETHVTAQGTTYDIKYYYRTHGQREAAVTETGQKEATDYTQYCQGDAIVTTWEDKRGMEYERSAYWSRVVTPDPVECGDGQLQTGDEQKQDIAKVFPIDDNDKRIIAMPIYWQPPYFNDTGLVTPTR